MGKQVEDKRADRRRRRSFTASFKAEVVSLVRREIGPEQRSRDVPRELRRTLVDQVPGVYRPRSTPTRPNGHCHPRAGDRDRTGDVQLGKMSIFGVFPFWKNYGRKFPLGRLGKHANEPRRCRYPKLQLNLIGTGNWATWVEPAFRQSPSEVQKHGKRGRFAPPRPNWEASL
jgi:hypothetical protein